MLRAMTRNKCSRSTRGIVLEFSAIELEILIREIGLRELHPCRAGDNIPGGVHLIFQIFGEGERITCQPHPPRNRERDGLRWQLRGAAEPAFEEIIIRWRDC